VIYEIINPSDKATMVADDDRDAVAACLFLSEGLYGLEEVGTGRQVLPILRFLPDHAEGILMEIFGGIGGNMAPYVDRNRLAIADALDSVMLGDRAAFDETMARLPEGERAAYRASVKEERRSSMNDIAGRAWKIAAKLRCPETADG
jgi:hypothetical protein